MEGQPLSKVDFARLKAGRPVSSAWQRVAAELHRPSESWEQTIRWTALALADEARRWQTALPTLLRGDFIFTLALWVAAFTVAAAVVGQPEFTIRVGLGRGGVRVRVWTCDFSYDYVKINAEYRT